MKLPDVAPGCRGRRLVLPPPLWLLLLLLLLLLPALVSGHAPAPAAAAAYGDYADDDDGGGGCAGLAARTAGVPAGAWDSHLHVTDPERFPPEPGAAYTPGVHTVWDNALFERSIRCEHVVLVQPSVYGSNNSLLLDSLRAYGPARARAVVVFDAAAPPAPARLRHWHGLGVRGVRVNLQSRPVPGALAALPPLLERYAAAVRPLGWALQLYVPMEALPALEAVIPRLGVRVVLDHFGGPALPSPVSPSLPLSSSSSSSSPSSSSSSSSSSPPPPPPPPLDPYRLAGFAALARLLRRGSVWVKLSAPYRLSRTPSPPGRGPYEDLDPLVRELLRLAPDRLVYGSDWPHTRFERLDIRPWTARLVALTGDDEALRRKLFRDNARALWDAAPAPAPAPPPGHEA